MQSVNTYSSNGCWNLNNKKNPRFITKKKHKPNITNTLSDLGVLSDEGGVDAGLLQVVSDQFVQQTCRCARGGTLTAPLCTDPDNKHLLWTVKKLIGVVLESKELNLASHVSI